MVTSTVRRRDRLYVSRGGRPVGWYDLTNGALEAAPGQDDVVRRAVDDWVRRTSPLRTRPLTPAWSSAGRVVAPRPVPERERTGGTTSAVPVVPRRTLPPTEPGAVAARRARELLDLTPSRRSLLGRRRPPHQARAWLQAAHGQRLVGLALAGLGAQWSVHHAVPLEAGAVVDHVVVGPSGVLAVTTRCHPGARVWVDGDRLRAGGQPTAHVREARRRAAEVAAVVDRTATELGLPPVPVQAVLVLAGARGVEVRRPAGDVVVLPDEAVRAWVAERPRRLAGSVLARLAAALDEADRWPGAQGSDVA